MMTKEECVKRLREYFADGWYEEDIEDDPEGRIVLHDWNRYVDEKEAKSWADAEKGIPREPPADW